MKERRKLHSNWYINTANNVPFFLMRHKRRPIEAFFMNYISKIIKITIDYLVCAPIMSCGKIVIKRQVNPSGGQNFRQNFDTGQHFHF